MRHQCYVVSSSQFGITFPWFRNIVTNSTSVGRSLLSCFRVVNALFYSICYPPIDDYTVVLLRIRHRRRQVALLLSLSPQTVRLWTSRQNINVSAFKSHVASQSKYYDSLNGSSSLSKAAAAGQDRRCCVLDSVDCDDNASGWGNFLSSFLPSLRLLRCVAPWSK